MGVGWGVRVSPLPCGRARCLSFVGDWGWTFRPGILFELSRLAGADARKQSYGHAVWIRS